VSVFADVFRVLESMKTDGVVVEYAVGGAMAALFYAEVTRTYDLDVFVLLPPQPGVIVQVTEIYRWAEARGFSSQAEHILIEGVPVQFLVADEGLEGDAVTMAETFDYQGAPIRVIRPEHLIALFLRAGGERRRERIGMLLDAESVDPDALDELLTRYNLKDEWQRRFGGDIGGSGDRERDGG
jgi:hypothetical protein